MEAECAPNSKTGELGRTWRGQKPCSLLGSRGPRASPLQADKKEYALAEAGGAYPATAGTPWRRRRRRRPLAPMPSWPSPTSRCSHRALQAPWPPQRCIFFVQHAARESSRQPPLAGLRAGSRAGYAAAAGSRALAVQEAGSQQQEQAARSNSMSRRSWEAPEQQPALPLPPRSWWAPCLPWVGQTPPCASWRCWPRCGAGLCAATCAMQCLGRTAVF